jgi:D-arabinono-1,4-lactone oxidase
MGANGALASAEAALTLLEGTPPWVLIPGFQVPVEAEKAQLAASVAANPNMTAGDMLRRALVAFWDLQAGAFIPILSAQQFASAYADSMGEGKRGRSDQIISGFKEQSLQACYRADSIEPAFDAHTAGYIDFLDAVIAGVANLKQAGYISLRWCATSMATLSMHNFPSRNAVSIEVTSLKGLPDNQTWMTTVETLALSHGGRPHWGQENHLSAQHVSQMFGSNLTAWRTALTALVGGSTTFSTAHTTQRGLEPLSQPAVPTRVGVRIPS